MVWFFGFLNCYKLPIQAETAEIKQLILEQEEKLEDSPDKLDDLQESVK